MVVTELMFYVDLRFLLLMIEVVLIDVVVKELKLFDGILMEVALM